ncbi:kinetochore Sim4 complex subunit FTA2-domain-containing protein [Nemania sp. FL0916]|nr:kinetochore Sim4 complex subunit FTA2-domain-containing protein [Nemania sp. FL0916]
MYPDWPRSDADLVPLPRCEGPKLPPFDFGGAQEMEFLEYAGEGLHAHVFKVAIRGQIYALKLFRFTFDHDWLGPAKDTDHSDREMMSAFYEYSEPFSCECRAFGRLRESGREELAVRCFGYVLLDEEHERALYAKFRNISSDEFNGNVYEYSGEDLRARFLGRDGRKPPLRGIVKHFGHPYNEAAEDFPETKQQLLRPAAVRKMLRDVCTLQRLGIFRIDVTARQLVDNRFSDFSTAVTTPHFVTTPELNPHLTPTMRAAMELETFTFAMGDFIYFDKMLELWNRDHTWVDGYQPRPGWRRFKIRAFPGGGRVRSIKYELRNRAALESAIFTHMDPRRYDWKKKKTGRTGQGKRVPLPPLKKWEYDCQGDSRLVKKLQKYNVEDPSLQWEYKDGFMFPREGCGHFYVSRRSKAMLQGNSPTLQSNLNSPTPQSNSPTTPDFRPEVLAMLDDLGF